MRSSKDSNKISRHWPYLFVMAAVFALDRITKLWAARELAAMPGGRMDWLPNIIGFRYVLNDGVAFSFLSGATWLITALTILLLAVLVGAFFARKKDSPPVKIALMMIVGGGLGNLYDRLFLSGGVIDFIEPLLIRFAIFNLADVFVVTGVLLAFIMLLRQMGKEHAREVANR